MKTYMVRCGFGNSDCIFEVNYVKQYADGSITTDVKGLATKFSDKEEAIEVMNQALEAFDDILQISVIDEFGNEVKNVTVDGKGKWVL